MCTQDETIEKINFEFQGVPFQADIYPDYDHGMPWEEYDGCGVVRVTSSHYGRPEKAPGEIIIHSERGQYWLYDFQATTEKAKNENWGIAGDTSGMSQGEIIREAVNRDMRYCRDFLTGARFYVVARVWCTRDNGPDENPDYLGGIEYGYSRDCAQYLRETIEEMASGLYDQRSDRWRAALKESRARKYWASRDVETVGA